MTMSARSWWPSLATPKQLVTGCHALHGGTQNDYVLSNNVLVQKMSPFPLKDMKIEVGTNMTSFTPNYAIDMQPIIGKASWKSRTCKSRAAGPIKFRGLGGPKKKIDIDHSLGIALPRGLDPERIQMKHHVYTVYTSIVWSRLAHGFYVPLKGSLMYLLRCADGLQTWCLRLSVFPWHGPLHLGFYSTLSATET